MDKTKEAFIIEYMPLVNFLAFKMAHHMPEHVAMEDIVSSGMIGLIEAANRFDSTKGIPFRSYAWRRIEGAMKDELRSLDWVSQSVRRKKLEPYTYENIPQEDKQDDPSKIVEHKQKKDIIIDAIMLLSEKEKMIIYLYYYKDLGMKVIGERLGIVESRVCQIHKKTIKHLSDILT